MSAKIVSNVGGLAYGLITSAIKLAIKLTIKLKTYKLLQLQQAAFCCSYNKKC